MPTLVKVHVSCHPERRTVTLHIDGVHHEMDPASARGIAQNLIEAAKRVAPEEEKQ
jgi:hypothetical protein